MDASERAIYAVRSAEVRIFLKVAAGIDVSDDQLTRLAPYLVPVRQVEVVIGSVHTQASEFARRGSIALALDHVTKKLAVGFLGEDSALRQEERFESTEMAVRVFLSLEDSGSDD